MAAHHFGVDLAGDGQHEIGIAVYPAPATDAEDLLRTADKALCSARREGRDQAVVAHVG